MPGLEIGDYLLDQRLEAYPDRQVWSGNQKSVKRAVELVCYFGPEPDEFLADIRVKAKVNDEVMGLVYEAIPTEEFIAFARETLPSKSLESIAKNSLYLLPVEVTRIISQVAATLKTLEKRGIAYESFTGEDIRLGLDNVVRMQNIAKSGAQYDDSASRAALSEVLRKLLKIGQPGATRMGTLIDYIEGTETQAAISWSQTEKLARQVDQQLSMANMPPPRSTPVLESNKGGRGAMIAGLVFGLVALIIGLFVFRGEKAEFEPELVITVPTGRYPHPEGGVIDLIGFRIDATEVTIGEYADFMMARQTMNPAQRQLLWADGTPSDKASVRPKDWNEYFPIARAQGTWRGLELSLDCPVVGVDYWDACAYANWRSGRLPTDEEWWAASSSMEAAKDQTNDWGPVGISESKILGLQGNVSEWARNFTKNPAFPIDSPKAMVLGGSFKKPSKGALTREWVESPTERRGDIGFRVVYPAK